jgi:outer membrane immunogenic protein
MKILLQTSVALMVVLASPVMAADIAVKAPSPVPPPVSDWSGIYVGLEGGYGWGKQSSNSFIPGDQFTPVFTPVDPTLSSIPSPTLFPPFFFPDVAVPSINQKGWLAGGFFGAQKQWGNWVLGIEGDIDGANIRGSGTSNASLASATSFFFQSNVVGPTEVFGIACGPSPCFTFNHNVSIDSKIEALASARGKVGWSFVPNWLIYGTGGAAFARVENTVISTESAVPAPTLAGVLFPCGVQVCHLSTSNILHNISGGTTMFGWVAGGGIDWKLPLDAGSGLVFGVEYLHYGFPDQTITALGNNNRTTENVDTVKGRISYLFSIH